MKKDKHDLRQELLDEFFVLGEILRMDTAPFKILKDKMFDFFRNYGYDIHISDAMTLLTINIEGIKDSDYDKSVLLAKQTCNRLLFGGLKNFYDVQMAAEYITYVFGFEDAKDLADLILEELKKYKNESRYEKVKWAVSINMLIRLVAQMYSKESIHLEQTEMGYHPELIFRQHFDDAVEICEKNDFHAPKVVCWLRRGCYFKKSRLVLENLIWLKENDADVHERMLLELKGYGLDPNNLGWLEE